MGDGDYVAEALLRRSQENAALAETIWRALNRASVMDVHQRLRSIPRRELSRLAREEATGALAKGGES
jgi:hypothetical protein